MWPLFLPSKNPSCPHWNYLTTHLGYWEIHSERDQIVNLGASTTTLFSSERNVKHLIPEEAVPGRLRWEYHFGRGAGGGVQSHPLNTKPKENLCTPSAAFTGGCRRLLRRKLPVHPPTREGGSEGQEVQKPTEEAWQTSMGEGEDRDDLHFAFSVLDDMF